MVEKLENEKLDFGNLKMLISPISMIWVQDELGDAIFQFWGRAEKISCPLKHSELNPEAIDIFAHQI